MIVLKSQLLAWTLTVMAAGACSQSGKTTAEADLYWSDQDVNAIRALLGGAYEASWNSHNPATALTPEKCADGAIFINTSGGWVKGCRALADLLATLHAPGGLFHDHTRRHAVEELRFIRQDVAIAVVKTFDIRRAGVPAPGEETRGLVMLSKEHGHWMVTANQNARIQATPVGNR